MFVISSVESVDYGVDTLYPMFVVADRAQAEAEMARLTRQDAIAAVLESARSNAMILWRHANPCPTLPISKPVFQQGRRGDKNYEKRHVQACQDVRNQQEAFERSPVMLAWKAAEQAAKEAVQKIEDVSEDDILKEMARFERYCLTEVQVLGT